MAETKTNIPVEIKMGNAGTNDANLPAFKEGSIIFTKDTKKIYIDPVGETERIAVGGTSIDDRSQFQKLIDEYDLTQRAYVDLTGLSTNRFYYNDFVTCVTDLNNDVTTSSVAKADTNVCVLIPFTYDGKKAYLLQLLAKVEITAPVRIMKSTIIDLNGFELAFIGKGKFGNANTFYSGSEFMIYGAELNSIISADPHTDTSNAFSVLQTCFTNSYYIGGKYVVNVTKFNKNNYIYDWLIADSNTTLEKHSINIYNVDIEYTVSLDYTKIATPKYSSVIYIKSDAEVILNMYNSTIHAHCDLTNTIQFDILAGNYTYKGNYTLKDCYLKTTCNDNTTITDGEDMACLGGGGNYNIINCNIQGRYLAASILQKGYISGSYFSGGHGLYCAGSHNTLVGADVYIQDSTFEYLPEMSPNGSAAMYVGYGSKVFVDNCTFILPNSTGNSFAIRAAGTPEGQTSRLYISNSSFTKPRVDAGQEIYYGEGISQEMRDYTVAGTKHNTTDNYSTYIKENALPIVDLEYNEISRNAQSGIAVKQALATKQDKFATIEDITSPYLILNFDSDGYVQTNLNINHPIIKDTSGSDEVKIDSKNVSIGDAFEGGVRFEAGSKNGDHLKITTGFNDNTTESKIQLLSYDNMEINGTVKISGVTDGTDNNDAVNVGQLNGKLDKQETLQYEGQPSQEHAQLGTTEIISAQTGTWVTDGWTGDATTGFTHTSGNTSILKYPITGSDYTAEGTLYDITFNCSIAPTVDNIMVRIGNSDLFNLYGQEEPLNVGVKSKGSTDGTIYLEFIPSSTFTGTISNIEVHKITGTYIGKYKIADNNLATSFEVRAGNHNKYNAFIGVDSGSYNTTGNGNVGFGYKALASNTSGFWNTGIGFEALQFVNAGSRNIGIGALAGRHIETGQRNVAIGTHTFRENRTGNNNIAIGADSQINGKSGNNNISIGVASLSFIEGDKNIAIGRGAMAVNSGDNKGTSNIAIGENSLSYGSNTKGNIAIGEIAGYKISGNYNVAIGGGACRNGSNQVVVGYNSGNKLEADAFGNTILGANSGNNLKSNRFCILIGNTISGEETGDYQLNIGNLIKGSTQSSNKYVNIDGSLSAKSMSVDNVGTNDTDVVNKKYVDDQIGNINSILATMFNDVSTQSDEEPTDEEVIA